MTYLQVDQVELRHEQKVILKEISFNLTQGQIACLLGPSGCGKTSLLRAIAGFEPITQGQITLANRLLSQSKFNLAIEQRKIGMVFQDYALFPHLTVADNIRFGIREHTRKTQQQRIQELLELVNLANYAQRYPHQLSGGQQQRIALARALAPKPHLLLLDEPFASQDSELREALAQEIRAILKHEQITGLLVTHDQQEAFAFADEIGVLSNGTLQQWGTGYEIYHQPNNTFVAGFIGQGSLIAAQISNEQFINTAVGELSYAGTISSKQALKVLIRPEDIYLDSAGFSAKVLHKTFQGQYYLYTLQLPNGENLVITDTNHPSYSIGSDIFFRLKSKNYVVIAD